MNTPSIPVTKSKSASSEDLTRATTTTTTTTTSKKPLARIDSTTHPKDELPGLSDLAGKVVGGDKEKVVDEDKEKEKGVMVTPKQDGATANPPPNVPSIHLRRNTRQVSRLAKHDTEDEHVDWDLPTPSPTNAPKKFFFPSKAEEKNFLLRQVPDSDDEDDGIATYEVVRKVEKKVENNINDAVSNINKKLDILLLR